MKQNINRQYRHVCRFCMGGPIFQKTLIKCPLQLCMTKIKGGKTSWSLQVLIGRKQRAACSYDSYSLYLALEPAISASSTWCHKHYNDNASGSTGRTEEKLCRDECSYSRRACLRSQIGKAAATQCWVTFIRRVLDWHVVISGRRDSCRQPRGVKPLQTLFREPLRIGGNLGNNIASVPGVA